MDKALEAATQALAAEFNKDDLPEGGWPAITRNGARAAITAYLAALPATDTSGLRTTLAAMEHKLMEAEAVIRGGLAVVSAERGWGTYPRMEGSEIYDEAQLFKEAARSYLEGRK